MPTVTVSTTQEIKIAPTTRTKLLRELRVYAELCAQKKALELAIEKRKGVIDDIRADTGQQSVALEGFVVTEVAPIRRVFNEKAFVANGGDLGIYQQSFDEKPSKAFCKISLPGQKDRE